MRVLIDAHMVGENETGNETYVLGLIRGLQRLEPPDDFLLATAHPEALADRLSPGGRFRLLPVSSSPFKRLFVDLPRLARLHKADLVHTTYASPVGCDRPVVTTIHDVSFRRHPEWFSLRDRLVLNTGVRHTARSEAHILTISRFSKDEIRHFYRVPDNRITVTYLAAPADGPRATDAEVDRCLRRLAVTAPYILAAGNVQPRKNLSRTIEAFALLRKQGETSCQLVIAGKDHHRSSEVRASVARLGLGDHVHFAGYVTESELAALYRRARAFCYASLYEGFGLPILEAMACGTPVVTSNLASMPEVAGDAARLVDPFNVADIAEGLRRILQYPACAETLRRQGLSRAAQFSWEKTAAETRATYAEVLKRAAH